MGRANRNTEFVWWWSESIGLRGFSVRSEGWSENSRYLAGRCLSKEGKEYTKLFSTYSKSGVSIKDRR